MKKIPNQYCAWIETIRKARVSGWRGSWLVWSAVALVLFGFSVYNLPARGLPTFAALFPAPSVTFIAKNDISAFAMLTKDNVDIMPLGTQATDEIKRQEARVYQHITLRAYEKGEDIQSKDLGPRLPANHTYQMREINASASITWMQVGNTLTFTLVNTSCFSGSATPTTACSLQAGAQASLKNTVIVQVGKADQNGLTRLLVAIPLEENTGAITFLDAGGSSVVAYPLATFTTLVHPQNGPSLVSSSIPSRRS